MGKQFVMGRTINEAIERAAEKEQKGYVYSYDMLGEGARTMKDAKRYFDSYMNAIHAIGKAANGRGPIKSPGISVKLSAIHPRYEFTHKERVMEEIVPKLKELALAAKNTTSVLLLMLKKQTVWIFLSMLLKRYLAMTTLAIGKVLV